jgi:hypothetical protein
LCKRKWKKKNPEWIRTNDQSCSFTRLTRSIKLWSLDVIWGIYSSIREQQGIIHLHDCLEWNKTPLPLNWLPIK